VEKFQDREDSSAAPRRVLIVDDDVPTARAMQELLCRAGFDASTCYEGTAAVARARELKPAALLLDIHLRDVSGLVLVHQLREVVGADVPIIMVSGDTSMETLNSLPHVGATYFLSKPMTADTLIAHVRERLK
jgi:two-component system response regulator MtrA